MRPTPAPQASQNLSHLLPPLSTTATSTCNPHTCRWRPYSNSNDFETNATMVLIILFCALICALALNAAIRCFLRGGSQRSPDHLPQTSQEVEQRKPTLEAAAAPLVVASTLEYSAGMKLAGAVAECAICLSEFVEGEGIQVLGRCKHGFHVHCIQEWLSSHSSCPTCRRTCLSSSPSLEENAAPCTPVVSEGGP